ncbi:unnamed protein product [Choristocarpus tenellus]
MQASLKVPMTVNGTGGQTRGFIHVTDTAKCLEAAVLNPPNHALRRAPSFHTMPHQVAETHRVRDLAQIISDKTGAGINNMSNPRNEAAENELLQH